MTHFVETFTNEAAYHAFAESSDYVTPNVSVCSGGGGSIFYNPKDYSLDYFTTVAKSNGTISFSGSSSNTLSYSTDNGTTWSTTAQTPTVNVNAGDNVLWKGTCTPNISLGIGQFTGGTAQFDVEGNVMSLLYGDNFKGQTSLVGKNYAFIRLFIGNTMVISAKNLSLPATALADWCYQNMFFGCTSLTTAPELPAMTLAYGCYSNMFYECTSLAAAPELPADTLAEYCYQSMFEGCSSLNNITCLATDISANGCTDSWVFRVAATGTFTKNASMGGWTTGFQGIPKNWTVVDK